MILFLEKCFIFLEIFYFVSQKMYHLRQPTGIDIISYVSSKDQLLWCFRFEFISTDIIYQMSYIQTNNKFEKKTYTNSVFFMLGTG